MSALRSFLGTLGADVAQLDADQLSFTRSIRLARRQVTTQATFSLATWPPGHLATAPAEGDLSALPLQGEDGCGD
ncbi:hypothetical protein ACWGJ2_00750 [Streptomyces sp. NPDC054796]